MHARHSTVERMRRERLNGLIDEVGEGGRGGGGRGRGRAARHRISSPWLPAPRRFRASTRRRRPCPPTPTSCACWSPPRPLPTTAARGLPSKRAKHAVLADAIAHLRRLQAAAAGSDAGTATAVAGEEGSRHGPPRGAAARPTPFPLLAAGLPAVSVRRGGGGAGDAPSLYVRVTAADRPALLRDLAAAVHALGLAVVRAAVVTDAPAAVACDMFHVVPAAESGALPAVGELEAVLAAAAAGWPGGGPPPDAEPDAKRARWAS